MAKKNGRVISVSQDGWATVITERGDACNNCESSQFCHAITDCSKMETAVLNRAGAKVGDVVTIGLSSKTVLKSAVVLYLIPTAALLSGAITGFSLSNNLAFNETVITIISSFLGLSLGFIISKLISKRLTAGNRLIPVITRIIKRNTQSISVS